MSKRAREFAAAQQKRQSPKTPDTARSHIRRAETHRVSERDVRLCPDSTLIPCHSPLLPVSRTGFAEQAAFRAVLLYSHPLSLQLPSFPQGGPGTLCVPIGHRSCEHRQTMDHMCVSQEGLRCCTVLFALADVKPSSVPEAVVVELHGQHKRRQRC